jgi:hypothetical protein
VSRLNDAIADVHVRSRGEAAQRFGCAGYCPNDQWFNIDATERAKWETPRTIVALAAHTNLACRFDGRAEAAYIPMKELPQRAKIIDNYLLKNGFAGRIGDFDCQ